MNKEIQPKQYKISAKCVTCGTEYPTTSTVKDINVDACSSCHPFYTGSLSSNKKAGRVERFNQKYSK